MLLSKCGKGELELDNSNYSYYGAIVVQTLNIDE